MNRFPIANKVNQDSMKLFAEMSIKKLSLAIRNVTN